MSHKSPTKKFSAPLGASLVVLSSFFYASYGIWTTLMGDFFDGFTASVIRSIVVVMILVLITIFYGGFEPIRFKENWKYLGGMIIGSLFTWGPLYYSILHAGVGISLAIAYASIVIGMFLFGWLFARERFTKNKAISAVLGILGLILIFFPTASHLGWLALIAALVSGLSTAANSIFSKKIQYGSRQSTLMLWIASIIANTFMVIALKRGYPPFHWQIEWFYLTLFAVTSVIASWSFVGGLKRIDAGSAGILGLLEIVFGVIFGVVLFHERPAIIVLIGMAIIMVSAAVPYIEELKAS